MLSVIHSVQYRNAEMVIAKPWMKERSTLAQYSATVGDTWVWWIFVSYCCR